MHREHVTRFVACGAALALTAGCMENPAAPHDGPESPSGQLTVEFSFTPDHVHILQSEVTFTVTVTDEHGEAVTDFEMLQVERLRDGTDTWRGVELARHGDAYEGTYVFSSSGEYELRVSGQRPGESEPRVLHHVPDPMHVVRAHAEAGGYRVEFESFPGHIHTGNAATLRFWVMEAEKDASGNRPPIPGLAVQIHCLDELHDALESGAGVYEAEHLFDVDGDFHVGLHLMGDSGHMEEAEFTVHVVPGH